MEEKESAIRKLRVYDLGHVHIRRGDNSTMVTRHQAIILLEKEEILPEDISFYDDDWRIRSLSDLKSPEK